MGKKILKISGELNPEDLGIVLPHEHLLIDTRAYWKEPEKEIDKELAKKPVTLDIRGDIVYRPFLFLENLYRDNIDDTIEELMLFKNQGGSSIVDLTNIGLGRNPFTLLSLYNATGVNIIMGTGYYLPFLYSSEIKSKSEAEITKDIVNEFEYGIDNSGMRPGIIGEVGIHDFDESDFEIKNLKASAKAQREIGCALNIHQPNWKRIGNKILNVLEKERVDLSRVILSHCDCDTLTKVADYHDSLAKRGAYIEYDIFGAEFSSVEGKFFPSDGERIRAIKEQIKRGNLKNILISHDACHKIAFTKWGGFGWAHILKHIVPRLKQEEITNEQIETIIIKNPKRVLSF